MSYLVHSDEDRKKILQEIGLKSIDDLYASIPKNIIYPSINLPDALSEKSIKEKLRSIGIKNKTVNYFSSFLGGGAYNHYIPAAVKAIQGISEFYTAYTPYQAEISQGTLQYIFEFQSLICRLTGMDIANASMYDGASAMAEAILLAHRYNGKSKVIVSSTVNPEYRATCNTYLSAKNISIINLDYLDGRLNLDLLSRELNDDTSAVVIQTPNFLGFFEEVFKIKEIISKYPSCLFIIAINPLSIGITKKPSDYGADIVLGDGQVLGNPLSFGGPYLGFFAAKEKFLRQMPGRIVVRTIDKKGKDTFVLSFQAREQHIRKSKATSNICSNHSLNALAAVVYLSILGEKGFIHIANTCLQRAHYFAKNIGATPKFKLKFNSPFFNEFVIYSDMNAKSVLRKLHNKKILGGLCLEDYYPEMYGCILVSVTEMNSIKEIDEYCKILQEM